MIRLFSFLFLVLALGWGFAWLADRPGLIQITWQDHLVETSVMVAATLVVALVAAAMFLWWAVNVIWGSPHAVSRYFRARKRDRGYQALSTGLIAAGAGNAVLARKMSQRSRELLRADQEPLILLLEAQADLIDGKHDEARSVFEKMVEDPETRELGLRGLYVEARRLGANEAARQYAEKAVENAPYLPWAAQAALESRSQAGRWDDAILLLRQQRAAHVLEKDKADRLKAVLLTAKAASRLEGDPKGARDDAKAALKLVKDFVPAAVIAAKALIRENNIGRAISLLEGVWKLTPHPQVAATYVRARTGDTTQDRLKRAEKLETLRPDHVESLLAVGAAALAAQDFTRARAKAEAAARREPREAAYLLLAEIEEAETGDQGRIRHWLAQALRAPRDPAWVADGFVSEKWLPLSPVTGRLDAFEWKVPFGQVEGPVEEGTLAAEHAIASLPPVTVVSAAPEPAEIIRPATVTVDAKPVAPPPQTAETAPVETGPIETAAVAPAPAPEIEEAASVEPAPVAEPPPPPKPAKVAAAAVKPAGKAEPAKETEKQEEEVVPFFGRPPDDPGVKDPDAAPSPTRLRLF